MSTLLLMTHPVPGKAASKICHDQPDLERSDNKFFSRNYSDDVESALTLKGVFSTMNNKCKMNCRY